MHKLIIIGNLGGDPEMRYTPDGQPVTSFNIASNRSYKTASGERREETEWFRATAWGKLAEVCNQYLEKGQKVYLEGRLKTKSWEDKSGATRFSNEIVVSSVEFLGGGKSEDSDQAADGPEDGSPDSPF